MTSALWPIDVLGSANCVEPIDRDLSDIHRVPLISTQHVNSLPILTDAYADAYVTTTFSNEDEDISHPDLPQTKTLAPFPLHRNAPGGPGERGEVVLGRNPRGACRRASDDTHSAE